MLFESKLKINEELSISNNVIKITDIIVNKSLTILPKLKLESSEKYRYFKQTDFDISTENLIPNTSVLHINLFAYYFDDKEDYIKHKSSINTNCISNFENKSIGLRLVMINGEPNEEFNSSIQHEVNHIYQYANGATKNEDLYDRVTKVANNKQFGYNDRIIALALYFTFTTEQDAFTNQYFAFLKQNKVGYDDIFCDFPEDKGNPYNYFLDLYNAICDININEAHLIKLFGITKKQLYLRLNNADKRIRNKLMKAAMRYENFLKNEQQKHSDELIYFHDMRNLSFMMECLRRGINCESSEFEIL